MSDKDHSFGSLVCIYSQILPRIREAGKAMGYAVAIHGSMERDLDLLAVPWIEEARPAEELVSFIAEAVSGFVIGDVEARGTIEQPTLRPHGRRSWNICWGGRAFIDLSVMPLRLDLAALEGREEEPRELRRIDPKFHIGEGGAIVKTSSGETVPEEEPLLLLRARDHLALPLLWHYRELSRLDGCNDYHLAGVDDRIVAFEQFKMGHPEQMKQPGVTRGASFVPEPFSPPRTPAEVYSDLVEKGIWEPGESR